MQLFNSDNSHIFHADTLRALLCLGENDNVWITEIAITNDNSKQQIRFFFPRSEKFVVELLTFLTDKYPDYIPELSKFQLTKIEEQNYKLFRAHCKLVKTTESIKVIIHKKTHFTVFQIGEHNFFFNCKTELVRLGEPTPMDTWFWPGKKYKFAVAIEGGASHVTFTKDGKKYTRKVQFNKRGTKCVKFDGDLVPVSKLKKV